MNLNLKQLETFVSVADQGSFRKSAQRLHTTQPNVSMRIASLETLLAVKLMERDAGSVRLTARGKELLVYARCVMRATEDLIEASKQTALFEGVLRLGVNEMIVDTWLRDFLRQLKEKLPNVLVELTVDLSVNLEQELFDRTVDITFQSGPFKHRTTGARSLGSYPLIWVASPKLALDVAHEQSIEDIARFPVLTHARNTQPYQELAEHFAARPDVDVRLVPSSSLSACRQMAIDGYGVSALLAPTVSGPLQRGELIALKYDWVPQRLKFFACYDESRATRIVKQAADLAVAQSKKYEKASIIQRIDSKLGLFDTAH